MPVKAELRAEVEAAVLSKAGVTPRQMMGTTAYMVGNRMFAFWVAEGLVVKLRDRERQELLDRKAGALFQGPQGRGFGEWTTLHLEKKANVTNVLEAVRSAYEYVRGSAAAAARTKSKRKGKRG